MLFRRRAQPIDLLTWVQSTDVNLLGGGTAPFKQHDWPNPRGRLFPVELRNFTNAAEIHLIGKDLFFTAAGMAPRYDFPNPMLRKSSIAAINAEPPPNLILTTLAYPFNQYEWPVPKGKPYPTDLRTFIAAARVDLVGLDVFYAGAGQVPTVNIENPRGKPFPTDQRGFLHSSDTRLIGQDVFYAGAGQAPCKDQPNPTVRKSSFVATTATTQSNLLGTTLAVAAASPFVPTEQPNPTQATRQAQVDVTTNVLASTLIAAKPIGQSTPDLPTRRTATATTDALPSLLLSTLAQQPFAQTAWPNPQTRRAAVVSDQYANTLLALTALPVGRCLDQPNPMAKRSTAALAHQPVNLLGNTLKPTTGGSRLLLIRRRAAQ